MENDDANVYHVCPGISFETMNDAILWFDGLSPILRELVKQIGETLSQFNDGEWGDNDGQPLLPDSWYRDTIMRFSLNDTDEFAVSLSEFERGQRTANGLIAHQWRRTFYDTIVPTLMGTQMTHTCRKYGRDLCPAAKRSKLKLDQQTALLKRRRMLQWTLKKRKSAEPEPIAKRTRSQSPKVRVKKTKAEMKKSIKKTIKKSKKNAKKKWKGCPSQKRR